MRRRPLVLWAGAGVVAACTTLALARFDLPVTSDATICFVRRATGFPCPGCGMTRAFGSLAHGDWAAAWRLHPLSFLVAAELAGGWLLWGLGAWRGAAVLSRSRVDALLLANAALLVTVWLVRAATGTLPP